MYKDPLVYQIVQKIDNMKYWDNWNGGLLILNWLFFLRKIFTFTFTHALAA